MTKNNEKIITRKSFLDLISQAFEVNPICCLLGPRQSGKTTIAREFVKDLDMNVTFFDLEDPMDLVKLENPKLIFLSLDGLIVIDEIQRMPNLFNVLRVLVDSYDKKFLILGSASQDLIRQSSETLAGRISYVQITPFNISEVSDYNVLLLRGGFPKSFLAKNDINSNEWRKGYINTFLERDIRSFGFEIAPKSIRKFWYMIAHYHGQIFNASEIGRSINTSYKTAEKYLDILNGTFMLRRLNPWFENLKKRQVKSSKIYFRDSGILNTILGIENTEQLILNPKLGAIWEGFAIEEVIRTLSIDENDCYFWRTQTGVELDFFVIYNGKKIGFEIKYTDHPRITKSIHTALEDLDLEKMFIIVPGKDSFPMNEKIRVVGVERISDLTSLISR